MNRFTTRVELHDSTSEDYKKLHEEMKKEGFKQTISLEGEDITWQLPTAEYNYSSNTKDSEDVLELAKTAANRTGRKFGVLVTKADGRRYWHGLKKVS
jgi:hypothetical protein